MKIPLRHCQVLLVAGYISLNLVAFAAATTSGVLSGDFIGFQAPSLATGAALAAAIGLSYLLVMFPLFDAFRHVGRLRRPRLDAASQPATVHLLVMALLLFQMLFAIATGVGTAGTFARTDSPLRFIVYVVPIDLVALIYFAAADNRRLYKTNLAIYLVSSLVRGWSFGIVFLLAIAAIRVGGIKLTPGRVLVAIGVFAVVAPLILLLRFFVREGGVDIGVAELLAYADLALDGSNVYLYILGFAADRLQHFTSVAHILENRATIAAAFDTGGFRPFFFDGTYFAPIAALVGQPLPLELNSWMTAHFHGIDFDAVAYNTHLGLIGWPIAVPLLLPVYLIYVGGLGLLSVLVSRATGSRAVIELTWLMWLLFLMNGWFGAFVSYLVALMFFRLLQLAARRRRPRGAPAALVAAPVQAQPA
jgi:hypothetical protein